MTSWLVLGAGYTGTRVAAALVARGDDVVITRRDPARAEASAAATGARAATVDLARPATLTGAIAPGATVVVTAPPLDEHGTGEAAVAAAAAAAPAARIIYLSSTGVYGPAGGAWVDEDAPLAPVARAGRARVAAETALATGPVPCVRLRVAGIHGPGRGVVARMQAGTYRLIGDGTGAVSRIHVDDLVAAVLAAGDAVSPGPVYNVADDDPCPSRELAEAAAAALGLPPPPIVPLDAVDPEVAAMVTADRRIANRRLKRELGWTPRHPSWRSSLPG